LLEYIDIKVGDNLIIIDNDNEKPAKVVKLYATCLHVIYKGVKYTVKKEFLIDDD